MELQRYVKLGEISDVYTAKELTELFDVSRSQISYMVRTGKIKAERIPPIQYVFRKANIIEYLERYENTKPI